MSSATVDRVINNRQGVRPRTRELVMTAARRLGYLPEGPPAILVEGRRAPLRFAFLLPSGSNVFIEALRRQIEVQAQERPDLDVRVEMIEGFNPDSLARRLDKVPASPDGLGLVALDHPLVREAPRRLARRGVKVVTLASDVLNVPRVAYVGIDNRQAGRLAGFILGRFLTGREAPKVAFFAGSRFYRGHEEREMGLRSVLADASQTPGSSRNAKAWTTASGPMPRRGPSSMRIPTSRPSTTPGPAIPASRGRSGSVASRAGSC